MKKITCFISSLASGGAEHQMAILANLLSAHNYDVTLVTCLDDPDCYCLSPDVHRITLKPHKGLAGAGMESLRFFIRHETDCIISFRERMNMVVLLSSFFRKKIKTIVGERNLTVGSPSLLGKLNYGILYHRADYIVANSHSQSKYLLSKNKSWGSRVRTITNYTDPDMYMPTPEPENDDILRIGVFARFSPQKNCTRFIQMISVLKQQRGRKFKITWFGHRYGAVNEEFYNTFIENLHRYDVEDVIEVHDPVNNVSEWMGAFHAICLPSLYEGFSNSISEGICAGKPMLVSNISDNCLMVKDEYNGFVFNPYNIDDMLLAFTRFFGLSKSARKQMGANSREIAINLFDKERFINDYIQLIEY